MSLLGLSKLAEIEALGITVATGAFLAEAAAVCLEKSGHMQGVSLKVRGKRRAAFEITWAHLPPTAVHTHNDLHDATEHGAMGLAILLARFHLGYEVVLRSRKGTGYDYLMRKVDSDVSAPNVRLEVSGILKGTAGDVTRRVNEKVRQVKAGASFRDDSPAFVMVIEFGLPVARIEEL